MKPLKIKIAFGFAEISSQAELQDFVKDCIDQGNSSSDVFRAILKARSAEENYV